jgi:hypothetical protein
LLQGFGYTGSIKQPRVMAAEEFQIIIPATAFFRFQKPVNAMNVLFPRAD